MSLGPCPSRAVLGGGKWETACFFEDRVPELGACEVGRERQPSVSRPGVSGTEAGGGEKHCCDPGSLQLLRRSRVPGSVQEAGQWATTLSGADPLG